MTAVRELFDIFCRMNEGWLPEVGKVYTITLDKFQRDALMEILGREESTVGVQIKNTGTIRALLKVMGEDVELEPGDEINLSIQTPGSAISPSADKGEQ